MRGMLWLCGLLALASCQSRSTPHDTTPPASPNRTTSATVTAAPVAPAPSDAPAPSASSDGKSPLDPKTPVVPKAERDAAVKLCCDMFGPYVTGCVALAERCYGDIHGYCDEAWKRGAHLTDVEPGIRKLVQKDRYYMPKQCLATPAP